MRGLTVDIRRILVAVGAAATLAAASIVAAPAASGVAGFGDVEGSAFYTNAVQWMVEEEITLGVSANCFAPYDPVTRGQAAAFMWRMEGEPTPTGQHSFGDVIEPWQQMPVSWMIEQVPPITLGTTATTFEPDLALNRGQLATFLWRLAGEPAGAPPNTFNDVPAGAFFEEAVNWMVAQDPPITQGTTDTTFSPFDTVTRGQVATFFYRFKDEPPVALDPTHPTNPPCPAQVAAPPPTSSSMPPAPFLTPSGMIVTRPFIGSTTSAFDGEGMAYVGVNEALWLADDNGDMLYEVDIETGSLMSSISAAELSVATRLGGGPAAGDARTGDLESLAYDSVNDILYAFSGTSCVCDPTAFRLTRASTSDPFTVDSYQELADGIDSVATTPTGQMYIAQDSPGPDDLHTYDYATNAVGPAFGIPGLAGAILGMGFSPDGADLYVLAPLRNELTRVDWATMTIETGPVELDDWMAQGRAVSVIGDQLFIQDGDDTLGTTDPDKYAVHIFDLG